MSDNEVHSDPPALAIVTDGVQAPDDVFAPALPRCGKLTGKGKECQLPVIAMGATVCRVHGGAAPQVRTAAIERLRDARDSALDRLVENLKVRGRDLDPRTLLDIVTRLTDKVELLEGRATARTETAEFNLTEIRATFSHKLDELASSYARAPMVLDMVDKMMGEGEYDEANG